MLTHLEFEAAGKGVCKTGLGRRPIFAGPQRITADVGRLYGQLLWVHVRHVDRERVPLSHAGARVRMRLQRMHLHLPVPTPALSALLAALAALAALATAPTVPAPGPSWSAARAHGERRSSS